MLVHGSSQDERAGRVGRDGTDKRIVTIHSAGSHKRATQLCGESKRSVTLVIGIQLSWPATEHFDMRKHLAQRHFERVVVELLDVVTILQDTV